jgi:peptide/nickel transport system permease protein
VRWPARITSALLGAALRLLAALFLGLVLFHVLPGDPALALNAGRPVSAEQLAAQRHELGLDRPLPAQFRSYLADTARGRLGTSWEYHRPVSALLRERIWPTALLVGTATLLAIALGLSTGTLAGWRPGGRFDRSTGTLALALWATPSVWLGLLLLIGFSVGIGPLPGWLPIGGIRSTPAAPGLLGGTLDVARHLVLPCTTLVAVQYAQYHLLTRASMLIERTKPYVSVARAKGLRAAEVRRRHVLANALPPVAAQAFLGLGFVLSGAVAVETVFSWPGLGHLAFEAVQIPDLPVLNGTYLVFSSCVIGVNLIADLVGARLDPRLTPGMGAAR